MLMGLQWLKCCVAPGKTTFIALIVAVVWVGVIYIYRTNGYSYMFYPNVKAKSTEIIFTGKFPDDESEHETLNRDCVFPSTDPFDPALKGIVKTYPPLDCSENKPHVVYVKNFVVKVNHTKLNQFLQPGQGFKHCWYKEIFRKKGADRSVYFGSPSPVFTHRIDVDPAHKDIVVECYYSNNEVISRSYFALIRVNEDTENFLKTNYEEHLSKNSPAETLSILMIGIDGMSKQNFERSMPKTRNFLLNKLGALELRKYNKLGYSTLPNVTPLLTGKTVNELEAKMKVKRGFLDPVNHLFLWSKARALGYRTGLILDSRQMTSFHYQRQGFNKSPVDYYFRPTLLAWGPDQLMRGTDKNCLGDKPIVNQLYDYWLQLVRTFKSKTTPYFGYSFAAVLTHGDCNKASKGDDAYHQFLQDLVATKALNNTVIVWFSDHGQRFGKIRSTYQGRIETNTPYLFLIFPPWFKKKYPNVMKVLKINQDRLATHFDVYETVKDLLFFHGKTGNGTVEERGISLFKEIPRERTCAQARIPEEYCACASFSQPNLEIDVVNKLSSALLDRINSFTEQVAEKCARLSLDTVDSILLIHSDTLKTMKSKSFRVVITAKPGLGKFEGLVQLNKKNGQTTIVGEVVRTNLYRGQAECVEDPILRQFCFCTA